MSFPLPLFFVWGRTISRAVLWFSFLLSSTTIPSITPSSPRITPALLTTTISTNLTGAFLTTQSAALQMSLQSPTGGSIIGISSISALVGGPRQCHYTPTKAGVLSLMQSCACALGKYGIRCNAILPGTIRTRLNEEDLGGEKGKEAEGKVPLGRLGMPGDIGGPAVFLASELSGYVVSVLFWL